MLHHNTLKILFISFHLAIGENGQDPGSKYINEKEAERMRNELAKREGYGTEWIIMPDGDEKPQIAFLKHEANSKMFGIWEDDKRDDTVEQPYNISQDIVYRLYTRSNMAGSIITLEDTSSLKKGKFDGTKPTKVVIHGWKSSGDSSTVTNIKDAYLTRSDVNVVGVDWSRIASTNYYLTPVGEIPQVGEHVAKMIDTMSESEGARHEDFHIIGHSLGAHVAGAAGSKTKSKISRITGLDPALPGFQYWQGPNGRLDPTDASFVEVIHTCGGALGISEPAGHADFYPNGGSPFQPGCCCVAEFTESCSHGRAHHYFAESINSDVPFQASQCSTWEDFKRGSCGSDAVVMGELTPPRTRGIYYLITNSSAPYALGPVGSKYFEEEDSYY